MPIPPTCPICLEEFKATTKVPRILTCGHTFCADCLQNYSNLTTCGYCRTSNNLSSVDNCPINYAVLDLANIDYNLLRLDKEHFNGIVMISNFKIQVCKEATRLQDYLQHKKEMIERNNCKRIICEIEKENIEEMMSNYGKHYFSVDKFENQLILAKRPKEMDENVEEIKDQVFKDSAKRETVREIISHRDDTMISYTFNEKELWSVVTSLDEDSFHLHSMTEHNPSKPHSYTLRSVFCDPLPTISVAFLDLECKHQPLGRIYVKVNTSNPYGEIFIKMCSGERGISHKNTGNFFNYVDGAIEDYVIMGSGEILGYKLFKDLVEKDYSINKTKMMKGDLFINKVADMSRIVRFQISVIDSNVEGNVYGSVISGLDILTSASKHDSPEYVIISDCGVVIHG